MVSSNRINQPPPYNQDSTSASHQADSRRLELELFRSKETMERLKGHHSEECKGLMLQIRYLKLKMMRESDQRQDLIHQKSYIVKLLSGFFQVDRVVERILFELEIPSGGGLQRRNDSEAKRRWNKVIIVARSIARMKLMREKWEKLDEIKQTLNQAHLQARSRRLTSKKVKGEEEEGGGEETIRRLPVKHRDEGRGVKK
ncbi:hypothetical protein IE53DRAFT_170793 [Violaceomyces palustris]|uniref:Uncharacterized protein n=1 Tax=Violaceomyces palustris TaxID=1673888 RepID=A0ACD0P5T5_9BASI|nr:hypothetical protein IE53DRAFT_170793 [Violaceomyces palustris]